jgi:hypothetical protein
MSIALPERPAPALPWFLNAVRTNPLVGLAEMHRSATEHEFIRELVSHPDFAADDLVIEFGNALYQDLLDAYISGEDIPIERLSQVWRNTTQSPVNTTWEAPVYAELLAAVREVNRAGGHLRVLAGDPPIDWGKLDKAEDWRDFGSKRDSHYISVVENEVLGRGRRALLLIGGMHLLRTARSGVGARFVDMPVIMPHGGFGALNHEVENIVSDWPVPSIAPVAGTPLGGLTMAHLNSHVFDGQGKPKEFPPWRWSELFDWYLYLGPAATLRWSTPGEAFDADFEAELQRRRNLVGKLLPPPPIPRTTG